MGKITERIFDVSGLKVEKSVNYTISLGSDDYEQLILACEYAFKYVMEMHQTGHYVSSTTRFQRLQQELENKR